MKKFYKYLDKEEGILSQEEKDVAFEQMNNYLEGALIAQKKDTGSLKKGIEILKAQFAKDPDEGTLRDLIKKQMLLDDTEKATSKIKALRDEYNKDDKE